MQFTLQRQACRLAHMNIRSEKHGDETRTAVDLELSLMTSNEALAMFAPSLRAALYKRAADNSAADLADQMNDPDALTALAFPALGTLRWDGEIVGADVRLHFGIAKNDVRFETAKVNKFRLSPANGGSVGIDFRVQSVASPDDVKRLSTMLEGEITVDLEPPSAEVTPIEQEASR